MFFKWIPRNLGLKDPETLPSPFHLATAGSDGFFEEGRNASYWTPNGLFPRWLILYVPETAKNGTPIGRSSAFMKINNPAGLFFKVQKKRIVFGTLLKFKLIMSKYILFGHFFY